MGESNRGEKKTDMDSVSTGWDGGPRRWPSDAVGRGGPATLAVGGQAMKTRFKPFIVMTFDGRSVCRPR